MSTLAQDFAAFAPLATTSFEKGLTAFLANAHSIPTTTPAPTFTPVLIQRFRAGGPAINTPLGQYAADPISGGTVSQTAANIANTTAPALYQMERWGQRIPYSFTVDKGATYKVVVHEAEIYFTSKGQRVFNVDLDGKRVLSKYDLFAAAGANSATTLEFTVVASSTSLPLVLSSLPAEGGVNNAKLSGVDVWLMSPAPAVVVPDQVATPVTTPVVTPPVVTPPVVTVPVVTTPVPTPVVTPPVTTPPVIDARIAPDPATGPPNGVNWQDPIVLLSEMRSDDGRIHLKGHYRNLNPNGVAVQTNCGDIQVVVDKNLIWSAGDCFRGGGGANIVGSDLGCYGMNVTADNLQKGFSLYAYRATNIDIKYFTQENIGGVRLQQWGGNHTPGQSIKIQNVRSRNIVGGDGGWRGGAKGSDEGRQYRHALQLMGIRTKGIELNWFEGYNEKGKSRIEDGFNFYESGGYDADSLLTGRGIFLKGSYPIPATDPYFTGCSFSFDGQPGISADRLTDNIYLRDAYSVSNGNAACNIPPHVGKNIVVEPLTAITSGYFPDGSPMACSYAAVCVGNSSKGGAGAGNYIKGLKVGWMRMKDTRARLDISPNSVAGRVLDITRLPDPITLEDEDEAFVAFRNLLYDNNQTCGFRF
jgi:hypothetical protein